MKKQIKMTSLAAGAALLATAGMAQAAPMEYNIFGASAQFDYWKAAAPNYLSQLGCTVGTVFSTGKHGFVKGTNCSSTLVKQDPADGNKRNIDFRFSGIASGEFQSVGGVQTVNPDVKCETEGGFYRKMKANADSSATLACKKVHLGASDLDAPSFTQFSFGNLHGPLGGDYYEGPNGVDTTGITKAGEAFAVPFGLFVNQAVTARHCTNAGYVGDICSSDTQCGGVAGACSTTSTTINNLSRLQTAMIFSGQVNSWRDFGPAYDDKQVVACIRHAGSGTAATFDNMVMSAGATGWGAGVAQYEQVFAPEDGVATLWFNESTDDLMHCVNGKNTVDADPSNDSGSLIAAVGYADADKGISSWPNVKKIKYNGNWPNAENINKGVYDYYSIATLWTHPSNTDQNTITNDATKGLIQFVKKASNIPSTKALYWVATESMTFKRGTDQAYPSRL